MVILTCTTLESPIIAWKSDKYIGTGGTQLEIAGVSSIGETVSSQRHPGTVATLTDKRPTSNNLLTSTLNITLLAEVEMGSVTCVNVGTGEMREITITLLGKNFILAPELFLI